MRRIIPALLGLLLVFPAALAARTHFPLEKAATLAGMLDELLAGLGEAPAGAPPVP